MSCQVQDAMQSHLARMARTRCRGDQRSFQDTNFFIIIGIIVIIIIIIIIRFVIIISKIIIINAIIINAIMIIKAEVKNDLSTRPFVTTSSSSDTFLDQSSYIQSPVMFYGALPFPLLSDRFNTADGLFLGGDLLATRPTDLREGIRLRAQQDLHQVVCGGRLQ